MVALRTGPSNPDPGKLPRVHVTWEVILESIVSAEFIDDEIEAAHEALATGVPRPRVPKRRSGATARLVHA
jgi:hypothetical protein